MSTPALSWTLRPFIGFDLETTGTDPTTARIVTIATIDEVGGAETWLVNPGIAIPDEATAVHGITTTHAKAEGWEPGMVLRELVPSLISAWQNGCLIAGHNIVYDLTVLAAELRRHCLEYKPLADFLGPVLDTYVLDKQVDPYRKGKRTLAATAEAWGVSLDDAHDAKADARAAVQIARRIAESEPAFTEATPAELMNLQKTWKREQSANLQAYLRRKDPKAVMESRWPIL